MLEPRRRGAGGSVMVEIGAAVVLVRGVDKLWHIPAGDDGETLCGLNGDRFIYASVVRRRRLCSVCHIRRPSNELLAEEAA